MRSPHRSTGNPIQILGNHAQEGAYVLHIQVGEELMLRFGRFQQAEPIAVAPGAYLYLGSAMGRGAALGRRIVRHLTRCEPLPPHILREQFIDTFSQISSGPIDLLPRHPKRLHWHIDYLLDQAHVEVTGVIALCSCIRLETVLATQLMADPVTSVFAPGLGASDARGATHLLRLDAGEVWWRDLGSRLALLLCL